MSLFRFAALNSTKDKKTKYISSVENLIKKIQYDTPKIDASVSILENFLFKICQYEHLGIEYDLINIYNEIFSHFHEGDNYEINYYKYIDIYIPRDCLEEIISNDISDNQVLINFRNQLITLSFGKDYSKVSRNEIKRFNTALNLITNQIALFDNHIKGNSFCEAIPLLLIAACIQDTLREPKKDKMSNKFMSVANIGSLLFIGCIKWLKYVIFSKPSVHILPRHIIGFHGNNGNITETNHTKN